MDGKKGAAKMEEGKKLDCVCVCVTWRGVTLLPMSK